MTERVDSEPKKSISIMLVFWYMCMILFTLALHALGIFTKDNSVTPYVILGIIAMLINPVGNMISTVIRINELKKEDAEREQAELAFKAKLNELTPEEIAEHEREKIRAAKELAGRHAANSGNMSEA